MASAEYQEYQRRLRQREVYQAASDDDKEFIRRQNMRCPSSPPLTLRALTIIPALIGFAILDITLVALTVANTAAVGLAPNPVTKGILVINEIALSTVDIFVAYLHISYAHWVVTGQGVHTWEDLKDWELCP